MNMLDQHRPLLPDVPAIAGLQDGWEFKVLRSKTGAFRRPEVLERAQSEEAQAGWILYEKLDDGHLRFKRPVSARANDHRLRLDAYRTSYSGSWISEHVFFILGLLCLLYTLYLAIAFIAG